MPGGNVRPLDASRVIARVRPSFRKLKPGPPSFREASSASSRPLQTKPVVRHPAGRKRRRRAVTWHLLTTTVTVKDGERALLTRNGQIERVLAPGRHRPIDWRNELTATVYNVVGTEFPTDR